MNWSAISIRSVLAALLLLVPFSLPAEPVSEPIVDVRIDAAYRQFESSKGDEWAPTWGRDDVLYTANNDGHSFGGIPENAITFGKLIGEDPYQLEGISISALREYSVQAQPGPEGAVWKTLNSYDLAGTSYRLASCQLSATCLEVSTTGGKAWTWVGSLFDRAKFANASFISVRPAFEAIVLGMSAQRPGEHAYAASFVTTRDGSDVYILGRVPKAKLANGSSQDWSYYGDDFQWVSDPASAKAIGNTWFLAPDEANWKTMNAYSVDGVLYMFVTRCVYPWVSGDPHLRHVFKHSNVVKSTDGGQTWTRAANLNYEEPMFPGQRFGAPYFVWYGKDGAASVDNADRYVYAISNNGHFEGGDDYILGRVLRTRLPALSAADWSFYRGGNGMQDSSWTPKLDDASPVLSHPRKSGMTGMTYIESLRRYVMVVWNYTHLSYGEAIAKKDVSTVMEFFEAPKPWGPWKKFKTLETGELGWYAPVVGQRFQTSADSRSVQAFLYVTGFTSKPEGGLDFARFKMNYIPITLSTRQLQHTDAAFVGAK